MPSSDDNAQPPTLPSLRGKFLLASATLADPNFARAIILIVRHDLNGALGIVVNRPLGVTLEEACSEEVEAARGVHLPLFHGGPCTGPLVAVHNLRSLAEAEAELGSSEDDDEDEETAASAAEQVVGNVYFCSRREALEALMKHLGHDSDGRDLADTAVKFVAGYAGWSAGQLESEIAEGSWQLLEASDIDVYAGGDSRHPTPPPDSALPNGAIGLIGMLGDEGIEPAATLAPGIRQWVRLRTRANLIRLIDPRLIPTDPTVN
ncbi:MAG: YqgE/AlgH family protein [Planctomycetota bacterium]